MEELESQIELFIENVRQLGIIVTDFQTGQPVLNNKINQVVSSLKDINQLKETIPDVQLPVDVFKYIDSGKNPQLFTKEKIESALKKNEEVCGKINHYKTFKQILVEELTTVFPSEMNKYHMNRPL